jgi:MFS family permease
VAGVLAAVFAARWGARDGLLYFSGGVIGLGTALAALATRETLPWARAASVQAHDDTRAPSQLAAMPTTRDVFAAMTWRDRRLVALCQAGHVEKFVDALVWVFWPVYLHRAGLSLPAVGSVIAAYAMTWGIAQLAAGPLSDRIGRRPLNVGGMVVCGLGVLAFPFAASAAGWSACAATTGLGMAMLYPNLAAAVADLAAPSWRASAIGIYRFWRDLGYAVGALVVGLAAASSGHIEIAFWCVGGAMLLSAAWLAWWGIETLPQRS